MFTLMSVLLCLRGLDFDASYRADLLAERAVRALLLYEMYSPAFREVQRERRAHAHASAASEALVVVYRPALFLSDALIHELHLFLMDF